MKLAFILTSFLINSSYAGLLSSELEKKESLQSLINECEHELDKSIDMVLECNNNKAELNLSVLRIAKIKNQLSKMTLGSRIDEISDAASELSRQDILKLLSLDLSVNGQINDEIHSLLSHSNESAIEIENEIKRLSDLEEKMKLEILNSKKMELLALHGSQIDKTAVKGLIVSKPENKMKELRDIQLQIALVELRKTSNYESILHFEQTLKVLHAESLGESILSNTISNRLKKLRVAWKLAHQ